LKENLLSGIPSLLEHTYFHRKQATTMKFTTATLITLFLLLATITTALPPQAPSPSSPPSLSTISLKPSLDQGTNLPELRRGQYIVKRASTGEVIGIVIGSLAGVIFLGLVCYISAKRT
jgi:hypothetical protein